MRTVVHAGAPPSIEAYLQESGRAGRDGAGAEAVLVAPFPPREPWAPAGTLERAREERMLGYAAAAEGGDDGCRRAFLMGLLGQPAPACSGCDVCRGEALGVPEGLPAILGFVARNRRRYTVRETALLLSGRSGGRGLLCGWELDDILGALSSLSAAGAVRRTGSIVWKHRLTAGRRRRGVSLSAVLSSRLQ